MRSLSLRCLVLVLPFIAPAIALAQSAPQPTARKVPPVWLGYLVIFVLLVIVLAVSMMPSKRGHQD
jgi:hypothetical protein